MINEGVSKQRYNVFVAAFSFGMLSVAAGLMAILFSYKKVIDIRTEHTRLQASVSELKTELDSLNKQKAVLVDFAKEDARIAAPVKPATNGQPVEMPPAERKAPAVKPPVVEKTVQAPITKVSSRDVVVTYYHRSADNAYLVATLQSLGYRFEGREVNGNTGNEKTNCIWYGAGVPAQDVKKVATALIHSGTAIKGIKRFAPSYRDPSYKRNIIEVGREESYEKRRTQPMSASDVQNARL